MKKLQIVPYWRKAYKLASAQVALGVIAFGALPLDQQTSILDSVHIPERYRLLVLGVGFLMSRILKAASDEGDQHVDASQADGR